MRYRVVIRSHTSNRHITTFAIDDLGSAYNVCVTLMRDTSWSRCYAVCTDVAGDEMFVLAPSGVTIEPITEVTPPVEAPECSGLFVIATEEAL